MKEAGNEVETAAESSTASGPGWDIPHGAAPIPHDNGPLLTVNEKPESVEEGNVGTSTAAELVLPESTVRGNVIVILTPHPVTVWQTVVHSGTPSGSMAEETAALESLFPAGKSEGDAGGSEDGGSREGGSEDVGSEPSESSTPYGEGGLKPVDD